MYGRQNLLKIQYREKSKPNQLAMRKITKFEIEWNLFPVGNCYLFEVEFMKFPFFAQSIDGYVAVLTLDKQYLVYVVCCCLQFFPGEKKYAHQKLDGTITA